MRRSVVSPAQRAEMRGDISGSDGLPESERMQGKIACQETGDRAQVSGTVHREIRVIWRKPDCLNPSLQKAQVNARRKDACNRRRPLRRDERSLAQSSGAQERCPVRAFKETDGTPKSRSTRTAVMNMGSPKGRESYGDGVPVVVGGVTTRPIWRPGEPDHRAKGHR